MSSSDSGAIFPLKPRKECQPRSFRLACLQGEVHPLIAFAPKLAFSAAQAKLSLCSEMCFSFRATGLLESIATIGCCYLVVLLEGLRSSVLPFPLAVFAEGGAPRGEVPALAIFPDLAFSAVEGKLRLFSEGFSFHAAGCLPAVVSMRSAINGLSPAVSAGMVEIAEEDGLFLLLVKVRRQ